MVSLRKTKQDIKNLFCITFFNFMFFFFFFFFFFLFFFSFIFRNFEYSNLTKSYNRNSDSPLELTKQLFDRNTEV
ncbi:hypothetical protein TRFO_08004 [Tritrichomonas foetus]|uniref:Uncharacterized protein n=1 Tax=Tritrichomonas foetus TaxID=1144522 RepID=A0A1J4JPK9_9EUKA|nr:hypothetical protein TRFO_08004 [Tritrichomonas foetus]|eukprot:OHT00336.1 hypothetical protein TRFO_08004 [Tritrichomonas foetus]